MTKNKKKFQFIDLFSGIGGFHQAMAQLGGECVFASEIDKYCNATYEKNYGISSDKNVRDIKVEEIPEHQVLCAGFPCQTFSKAGKQEGLKDETRGTLFYEITRILHAHHTKYIVLENVRNLVSHDHGNTWKVIKEKLHEEGYRITETPIILSPHQFGVPQLRERVIILGVYDPKHRYDGLEIKFDNLKKKSDNSIYDILDDEELVDEKYRITDHEKMVLTAWDEFYQGIDLKVIGFPVWSEYFKYDKAPDDVPDWKAAFINRNIKLYKDNKKFIDEWLKKYNNLKDFTKTERKFEWQAGTDAESIKDTVIQFRPSGVRVKRPDCFPALVAMVQIPIIGKYERRLTLEEAAKLQSFPTDFKMDSLDHQAYKQFGNSVNVDVIKESAKKLFEQFDYDFENEIED